MGSLTTGSPTGSLSSFWESGLNVQSGHSEDLVLALRSELCSIGTGVTETVTKTFPLLSWIVFSGSSWSPGTYGGIMRWLTWVWW